MPFKLKSRYIDFKDNLQNESGTNVEFIFTGILYMNLEKQKYIVMLIYFKQLYEVII